MGKRNSIHYVSKKDWVGGIRKFLLTFSYVFAINADILGGWVRKSSKMCDVIHGWSQLNSITYQPKITSNLVYRDRGLFIFDVYESTHSMARANLNRFESYMTNTTAEPNCIFKRARIFIF